MKKKKIIGIILATVLVAAGLGSFAHAQEGPVNEVSVGFITSWFYDSLEDTFTNGEVTGRNWWHAHMWNSADGTGAVTAAELSLASELVFDYVEHEEYLTQRGPPTYEWSYGDVPEGSDAHGGVCFLTPDPFPVTFSPGFDASRTVDKTEFLQSEGIQTQTLTITLTPREMTEGFVIRVLTDANDLVDAVIYPPTNGDDFDLLDGCLLDIWPTGLKIGTTYTYNVTIEVTPKVPEVKFMPYVDVGWHEPLAEGTTSGSSVSCPADGPVSEAGTWTWSADGSYLWHWWEGLGRGVAWESCCREIITVEIDIKPGSYPNSINLKSKGVVPVAVLTTDDFDASTVNPQTVLFISAEPVRWVMEDVDGDGDLDMLFHFKTQELDLDEDSTEATLIGYTYGSPDRLIEGKDTVNIVPKGK